MLFLLSLGLWLLLCGRVTAEVLLFGVGMAVLCCLACRKLLGWSPDKERALVRRLPRVLKLLSVLLWEIFKANLAVIRYVYSRTEPESVYIKFNPALKRKASRTALGDCITLTPGTITGTLQNGEYTVHCLDKSMGEGLESSAFVTLLRETEAEK